VIYLDKAAYVDGAVSQATATHLDEVAYLDGADLKIATTSTQRYSNQTAPC